MTYMYLRSYETEIFTEISLHVNIFLLSSILVSDELKSTRRIFSYLVLLLFTSRKFSSLFHDC